MEVKIARNLLLFFSEFVRRRNYPSPAIWLVPWTGGFLWSCPLTRAEFLRNELCSGFFKHENIKHVNFYFLTYRRGYHNESEFYYPHKMTNESEKENIGAIRNSAKCRCLYDGRRAELHFNPTSGKHSLKNTDYDLTSQWPRALFKAKSSDRPRPVNDIFFFNFRLGTVQWVWYFNDDYVCDDNGWTQLSWILYTLGRPCVFNIDKYSLYCIGSWDADYHDEYAGKTKDVFSFLSKELRFARVCLCHVSSDFL